MKRKIEYMLARILSFVNILIPKKSNMIIFYDSLNKTLLDNTEAFYQYIKDNDKTNKFEKVILLPKGNSKHNKIYCALKYMRAKYVFFSFGDLRIKPSKNQIVVNQWHGSPIKTIGKLTKYSDYQSERLDNFTYLISSSELFVEPFCKAFGCDKSKIKVIGQARNDYFYSKVKTDYFTKRLDGDKYKKTIIWMPTFRLSKDKRFVDCSEINQETLLPIFPSFEKLNALNKFLNNEKVLLVIKIHGYSSFVNKNYSNIKYVSNDDLTETNTKLYSFIKDFDSLITDYSSVFTDYYLLNKPVGFTVDDYDAYNSERGFSIDEPKKYMIGDFIENIDDFYKYIFNVIEGNDKLSKKRNEVMKLVNKYNDDNCKRLCQLVGISF